MADFVKTISNNLNIFGIDRPNLWGSFLWGQNWGYGNNDLIVTVFKVFNHTLSLSDSTAISIGYIRTFVSTLAVTADMGNESIIDAAGYKFVFGVSGNAEDRPLTGYNGVSSPAASFTTVTNTATTWVRQ